MRANNVRTGILAGACLILGNVAVWSSPSLARTVRFSNLTAGDVRALRVGDSDLTIEFVQGDQIPLHPSISGNLLATTGTSTVTVTAQSTFFLKRDGDEILISTDGTQFSPKVSKGGEVGNDQPRICGHLHVHVCVSSGC